jgi:hypothetical protein
MSKRKLVLHSNSPWTGTGYGTQTALFSVRLKEKYELAISAFYGLEGGVIPWHGIPVLPAGSPNGYGNDSIREHVQVWGGTDPMVVTLMDVWVLDPQVWAGLNVPSVFPIG